MYVHALICAHVFVSSNAAGFLWTSNLYSACLYVLFKRVKLLIEKRTLKASFFSRQQRESDSLAEVQFVIDSCRLVSQSNYLNNSNKDYDRLILGCFIRDKYTADATLTPLENEVWLANAWVNY